MRHSPQSDNPPKLGNPVDVEDTPEVDAVDPLEDETGVKERLREPGFAVSVAETGGGVRLAWAAT